VTAPAVPTAAVTYFEDVEVGDGELTPAMTLTTAHAALYRGLVGEVPDDPAEIPDLLPLCVATGLGWRTARPPLAVLAFMSFDWKVHRALRVGDTIHGRARVALKRSMREGGVVIEDHELIDQHGAVTQAGRFTFLVAKRTGGSDRRTGGSDRRTGGSDRRTGGSDGRPTATTAADARVSMPGGQTT
jgi:acyl dehydratase